MRKVTRTFLETMEIIKAMTILFIVMIIGSVGLGLPAFIMLFIISVFV